MNALSLVPHPLPVALIGDIGGGELLVVLAAILMLFGGRKLPSVARMLGKTVEDLRRASQDFREQLLNADQELARTFEEPLHTPMPDPQRLAAGERAPASGSIPVEPEPPLSPMSDRRAVGHDDAGLHDEAGADGLDTASAANPPSQEMTSRDLAG